MKTCLVIVDWSLVNRCSGEVRHGSCINFDGFMFVLQSSHRSRPSSTQDQVVIEWSPDGVHLAVPWLFYKHPTDHAHHRPPTTWGDQLVTS